jgi:hypothetical protein
MVAPSHQVKILPRKLMTMFPCPRRYKLLPLVRKLLGKRGDGLTS